MLDVSKLSTFIWLFSEVAGDCCVAFHGVVSSECLADAYRDAT
jgi:hypothetical protein